MQKAIWITFGLSLVLVNVVAELVFYFSGQEIVMIFRVVLILGITMITAIFAGAFMLVGTMEGEKPLSGHVSDTLGSDRKIKPDLNSQADSINTPVANPQDNIDQGKS